METELKTAKPASENKTKEKGVTGIVGRLKKIKHIELILAGLAVVIMLAIYFGSNFNLTGAASNQPQQTAAENYLLRIERELSETLSKMEGAGDTKVIINWESGVESVIAYITNSSQNSNSQSPQIISGGGAQSPVILKEIYPKALGVVILTQGGDNVKTKLDLISAVSVLLGITPDKIQVLTMKK